MSKIFLCFIFFALGVCFAGGIMYQTAKVTLKIEDVTAGYAACLRTAIEKKDPRPFIVDYIDKWAYRDHMRAYCKHIGRKPI